MHPKEDEKMAKMVKVAARQAKRDADIG